MLYDFTADGEDELTVREGETLMVLERDGDEWWKCRNQDGLVGVVPASYVEVSLGRPLVFLFVENNHSLFRMPLERSLRKSTLLLPSQHKLQRLERLNKRRMQSKNESR